MTRIFVYGTLKKGCKNHPHLADQTYVGDARTAPGYRLHDLGDYPGMVAGGDSVTGEVWSVDAASLARLDAFEGVDEGLYRREPVKLLPPFDRETVWTYLYARDPAGRPAIAADTWTE